MGLVVRGSRCGRRLRLRFGVALGRLMALALRRLRLRCSFRRLPIAFRFRRAMPLQRPQLRLGPALEYSLLGGGCVGNPSTKTANVRYRPRLGGSHAHTHDWNQVWLVGVMFCGPAGSPPSLGSSRLCQRRPRCPWTSVPRSQRQPDVAPVMALPVSPSNTCVLNDDARREMQFELCIFHSGEALALAFFCFASFLPPLCGRRC